MSAGVFEAATWLAHEGAVLFDQEPASLIAVGASEPGALSKFAHDPFAFEIHRLLIRTTGDDDLSQPEEAAGADPAAVLQQLMGLPLGWSSCSKSHAFFEFVKLTRAGVWS